MYTDTAIEYSFAVHTRYVRRSELTVHTRYVQRAYCREIPPSWMDLGRFSGEEEGGPWTRSVSERGVVPGAGLFFPAGPAPQIGLLCPPVAPISEKKADLYQIICQPAPDRQERKTGNN